MMIAVRVGLALLSAVSLRGQPAEGNASGGVSGVVWFPDGRSGGGARISAITECKGMGYNLVKEVRAGSDGSFHIPPFVESDCNEIRLYAEKPEDLWLKTGTNVFYKGDNGTTPTVSTPRSGPPAESDITMGIQGGLLSVRVRDTSSGRFIWAVLSLEKAPRGDYGSMSIATGRDGSPDELLLPEGLYEAAVTLCYCGGKSYFPRAPIRETFSLTAGQKLAKELSVDVRQMRSAKSHDNPKGRDCTP